MTTFTQKLTTFVAAFALVAAMVMTLAAPAAHAALTDSQIQSILSLLTSFGADQATIDNVDASLRGETPTATPGTGSSSDVCPYTWTRSLTVGDTGADVMALQKFLNADSTTQLAASGAGSPGNETSYFGSISAAAVAKFQNQYASEVLAPLGLAKGTGYFGASSRAKANELCATAAPVDDNDDDTPAPTGSGLSVSSASQPANSLAPQGASRVPFTRFTVTAGTDGAVNMNNVVVQRTGLGSNAAFDGVVLIDQDGVQLGTSKTFNSNDQATIGESVMIPAGQSRTFTIAGNMNSSLGSYAGEAPSISLVAVNSAANVSGSLPIVGAHHTINATLSVGTLSLDTSSAFASNTSGSDEIGTTNKRVTGFRVTAGSAEDVRLKIVRFNQTGSASTDRDIDNIRIVVDGTAYPATVSSNGDFITANLGSGILIQKGNSVEVYAQYDIVSGSGRTVVFDVDDTTDIFAEGVTYGYGISPTTSGGVAVPSSRGNTTETTGTPYIYGNQVTVSGASVTAINKSNGVPAQNIAVNVSNQPLGGFKVNIKGEAITVQQLVFDVATSSGATRLTNVTIVDSNGSVVAGPVDSPAAATNGHSLTFSDAITFPVGEHTYTLRGKVASGATNGATYTLSTDPSSDWTNVKGNSTGDTISLSQSSFNMNTMTVKAATLAVGLANNPASQTVVAGGTSVTMAAFQLSATQSGEDVRLSSFPAILDVSAASSLHGAPNLLSSCQLFDGNTALNTGSNTVNPSGTATSSDNSNTFTFDSPITITKGSVKTLTLKCSLSSSIPTNSKYVWDHAAIGNFSSVGANSNSSITETEISDSAVVMTVAGTGTVTVDEAASSPAYGLAAAGTTGVEIGAYRFRATNEAVDLQELGLQLSNTASSSSSDVTRVTVWDGGDMVGEAFFTGSGTTATSTFSSVVTLPKNEDKVLTVKADLTNVGVSQAVDFSGHLLAVDYLNAEGVGAESGETIQLGSGAGSTSVAGVRIFKSYPTVSQGSLASNGVSDGRLMRFSVTANSVGSIGLAEFNLNIATSSSGISVTGVNVYGFTDSGYSQAISGVTSGGQLTSSNVNPGPSGNVAIPIQNSSGSEIAIQVPAGATRYFEVRAATVSGVDSGETVTTKLLGDSSFPSTGATVAQNPLLTASGVGSNFVWSPNSTTTAGVGGQDWTNGYGIPGLPSNGLIQTRSN